MNVRGIVSALLCCVTIGASGAEPRKYQRENYDRRDSVAPFLEETAAPEWRDAKDKVSERVRGIRIDPDRLTGAAKLVASTEAFLTGPLGEGGAVSAAAARAIPAFDEHRAVKAFLNEHHVLFGHDAKALNKARVTRDDTSAHSGMRTVVWQQVLDGIPVFEGILKAHTTKNGELVNIGSQFTADPASAADKGSANRYALQATPTIPAQAAVAIAAQKVGEEIQATDITPLNDEQGAEKTQRFKNAKLIDPSARLAWFPLDASTLRLCWDVILMSKEQKVMYRVLIDAETGEMMLRRSLTNDLSNASYRVFTGDSPTPFSPGWPTPNSGQPASVNRTLVTTPALDTTASPNGWIDDGGNQTLGNNVDAHLDVNADNSPDLPRPQGSPNRVFDFTLDLTADPSTTNNQNAAVVQLFYWCNWMHDRLYELGFTESAGNFQTNNFGRGGVGNDALQADAQDGSGTNNANFSTPPDGTAPRMQMYLFTGASPHRDACFDAEIVLHEHTHGLSNRLVGGGVGISALQSGGMGEGWSDFYGLALLSQNGDNVNGNYAAGAYCTYMLSGMTQNYYYGIRRYPYSTDMTKNPLTLKDIDPTKYSTHSGIPMSPIMGNSPSEVHCQGEVWCVTLWEARANLINKYGWTLGNQLILQIVTDGMKLSPANPTFLQARDAIIQADLVDNGGANKSQLWAAFAKRGMGASAVVPASTTTTGVTEAYDLPDTLSVTPMTSWSPSGTVGGPFASGTTVYTLVNTGAVPVSWTASKTQPWLTLSSQSGVIAVGGSTTVTATINPGANTLNAATYSDNISFANLTTGMISVRAVSLTVSPPRLFLFDMTTDPGWTKQGQWAFGKPSGSGGGTYGYSDPAAGATGTNVCGVNLAGNYSTTIGGPYYLTAGPFNFSTNTGVKLQFQRWLNTDYQPWVSATIDVSNNGTTWTSVFANPTSTPIYDAAWTKVQYDISSVADKHSAVYVRWGYAVLQSGAFPCSGWNIDDVEFLGAASSVLTINIPASASEASGVVTGTVALSPTPTTDVTVSLVSSDDKTVTVPSTVIIPAGNTNATFNLTVLNDSLLNGTRSVTITGSASGCNAQNDTMIVTDDESAILNVSLPASIKEGASAASGTVTMSASAGADVVISLATSDPTRATVPATVTMPSGQTAVTFYLSAMDDNKINGNETVTVTAHVDNWTDGSTPIDVLDSANKNLTLSIPDTAREGDGMKSGTVQISGVLPSDLVIALDSNNNRRIVVPPTVTIPASKTSGTFSITVVDNTDTDGTETVTVAARAVDFVSSSGSITVSDNDADHFKISAIPTPQIRNAPFAVAISAYDITDTLIPNYSGTVTLVGSTTSGTVPISPVTSGSFVNGVWAGNISVDAIASRVTISADDGNRHIGTSNLFDVGYGPLDHFAWSSIASPQLVDNPFTITLTAQDIGNNPAASFSGSANLSVIASIPNPAIGTGTGTWYLPMYQTYAKARTQVIYLANELGGAGTLSALSLYVGTVPGSAMNNWTIRVKPTTLASYSSASWDSTGWTTVCQQTLNVTGTGWVTIPFSTPFAYDGVSNLMVDFSFNNSVSSGTNGYCRQTTSTSSRAVYGYSSTVDPLTWAGTAGATPYTSTYVPNVQFSVEKTLAVTPSATGAFVSGSWTGSVSVPFAATGLKLSASDGSGHSGTSGAFTVNATTIPSPTTTGSASRFLYFPMDTDPGWARQGEWAFGVPTGGGGASHGNPDPSAGATGANAFGINLNGDYSTTVGGPYYLTTGPLDCSSRSATKLQFQRWMNTDTSPYVVSTVEVSNDGTNWTSVWNNTTSVNDSAWTKVQYDISSVADNKPAVYVRWSHKIGLAGAYAYSGWNIDDVELIGTAPLPTLSVSAPTGVIEGAGVVSGTVTLPLAQATDTVINLVSTSPAKLAVPVSVTIPAGQLSATFTINVLDDSIIDGTKTVGIVASAPGFNSNDVVIQVADNDVDTLSLNIPASAMENAGSVQGTLSLAVAASSPVQVNLVSSDTNSVVVPTSVTIPLGQTTVPFTITLVDNNGIDGNRPVTITAHVENWSDATATMTVIDNENTNLVLMLPPSIVESGSGTGIVSIAGTLPADLSVTLVSSDPSRLTVPATVTILAGQTSGTIALVAPDNTLMDGAEWVNVTASATGFVAATGSTNVLDNDLHHFGISAIASPQTKGVGFGVTFSAKDVNGVTIPTYSGTLSLTASGSSGGIPVTPTSATLTNGTWTGNVTLNTADPSVVLTVSDGVDHSGTSNAFSVLAVESFYDAFSSFSSTANPTGPWRYGYATTLTGTFSLSTVSGTTNSNTCAYWQPTANASMVMKNVSGQDYSDPVQQCTVPGADYLLMQPGASGEYAVVRWTAAVSGTYQLVSTFKSLQTGTTAATTDIHVLLNSVSAFDGSINSAAPSSEQYFTKIFTVSAGSTIDLVVGSGTNGTSTFDATGLQASIIPINATSSVTTLLATNVRSGSAVLNGMVSPGGLSTSAYFEYGTTTAYGNATTAQIISSGTGVALSGTVSGLTANTVYHFHAVSTNTSGTNYGLDQTVTTLADGTVYDFFDQYCTTSNPSPDGRWRYGSTTTMGGSFNLYLTGSTIYGKNWVWQDSTTSNVLLCEKNLTGLDWDDGVGLNRSTEFVVMHPGPSGQYSVSRWIAPVSGTYQISAAFESTHLSIQGASTDIHVLQNSLAIFNGSMVGYFPNSRQNFSKTVLLNAGDTIDFALGNGSNGNSYDATNIKGLVILVGNAGIGNPVLNVTPSDGLSASGPVGGPFTPSNRVYTLVNTGSNTLNWSIAGATSWVSLSSTAGTLAVDGSTTVTATINSNANTFATGTYANSVTITDLTNGGAYTTRSAVLTVSLPQAPVITSAPTTTGTYGSAFSYQIVASNLPTSYGASALPTGLSVNTSTGLISGTPTQTGTFNATISATNAGGTGSATLALTIQTPAPPVITSSLSTTGTFGKAFSYQITATNSPTSYGTIGLPSGLSVNAATGLISGTPTQSGTFNATISATNLGGSDSETLVLTVLPAPPAITSATTANTNVGSAFSYQIAASNSPTSYGATNLPSGITVNTLTGVISGTPTQTGTFNSNISATNAGGTGTAILVLTVKTPLPVITSPTTATGTNGYVFNYQITATNFPTSYGASGLPAGLNQSAGLISGTPTQSGTFNVTISGSNAGGSGSATLVLTILPHPPVVTSSGTASGTVGSPFSYQITTGTTWLATSYGATGLPGGLDVNTATGLISGTPTQPGTFNASISASNSGGTGSATLVLTIKSPLPVITSSTIASGTFGSAFSYQITATNLPTSYGAAGLPVGLTVDTSTGLISGTLMQTGSFNVTVSATNAWGSGSATLTINAPTLVCWGYNAFGQATSPVGLNSVIAIAGGFENSFALKSNGTLVAWGYSWAAPAPNGLNNVVAIAGGDDLGLALKSDGTVVAWGWNFYGETNVPTGLSNVVAIAAGDYHSLALKSDGTVVGWGFNGDGETNVPTGLSNVVAIAAGNYHSLALKSDGTIVGWGFNVGGETNAPTGLSNVVAIAAGEYFSLALKSDGTVVAWGFGSGKSAPSGLTNVVAITASGSHALALKSDGTVVAWGANSYGETNVPTGLNNVVAIAAGGFHSLALTGNDSTTSPPVIISPRKALGAQNPFQYRIMAKNSPTSYGASGLPAGLITNTATGVISGTPTQSGTYSVVISATNTFGAGSATLELTVLPPPPPVITSSTSVSGTFGLAFSYQIAATNSPTSYGATGLPAGLSVNPSTGLISGSIAQTGVFNATISATNAGGTVSATLTINIQTLVVWGVNSYGETTVSNDLNNVVAVAATWYDSFALKADGTVLAWGLNDCGQTTVPAGLHNVVAISAGGGSALALKSDGTVVAWGDNTSGHSTVPDGLKNVVAISSGAYFNLALKSDGTVVAWGASDMTVVPNGLCNVVEIAAGEWHSLALKSDGTVVAWGDNTYGQATVPAGLNNVVAVAGGRYHSMALKADGTVVAWGWNESGETTVPVGLNNVVAIAAGFGYSLALKSDGTLVDWGWMSAPTGLNQVVAISAGYEHALALTGNDSPAAPPVIISHWKALGSQYPFQYRIIAKNNPTGYGAAGLPLGLSINNATGLISGTPTQTGTYSVVISATNAAGTSAATLVLTILPNQPPTITGSLTPGGCIGGLFRYQITATNAPTGYNAVSLPSWLGINTSTGLLSGTPTQTGTFSSIISASNAIGSGSATLTITVRLPLDAWRNRHFTDTEQLDESISGHKACPAGDGISNLMKYALNLDPWVNGQNSLPVAAPMAIASDKFLTLQYTRPISATDIDYSVEVSGDMQTWRAGGGITSIVSITNNPDGITQTIVVQDITSMNAAPKRFIRLKVTKP